MQINLDLAQTAGENLVERLLKALREQLAEFETELVTDLSHISHFANAKGNMTLDRLEDQGEQEYLLFYSFDWQINNACADQLHEGRIHEKVRFVFQPPGLVTFKILRFDM